ncbi:MAG: hypothetical protein N2484_16585 [Clostridia bacterium]|nr:hypothetical protein [Clostridia bacterium]
MIPTNEKIRQAIALIRNAEEDFDLIDPLQGLSNRRFELLCIRNDLEAFLKRLELR